MSVKIVRATAEDMPEVARLFRISRESQLPYLPKLHTPAEDLTYFTNIVFRSQIVELLRDGHQLLGFVAYDPDWVHHLYLHPDAIGKGYGEKLLKRAKRYRKRLKLWVFKRNQKAIDFYKKHGFHVIKETDGRANEEKEPDVLMHWPEIKWQRIRDVRIYDADGLREAFEARIGAANTKNWIVQNSVIAHDFCTILRGLGLMLPSYTHLYVFIALGVSEGAFQYVPSMESWFRAIGIGVSIDSLVSTSGQTQIAVVTNIVADAILEIAKEDGFDEKLVLLARDISLFLDEPSEMVHRICICDDTPVVVSYTLEDPLHSLVYKRVGRPELGPSNVYVTWKDAQTGQIKRKLAAKLKFAWQIDHFVDGATVKDDVIILRPKATAKRVIEKGLTAPGTEIPIRVKME